MYSLVLMMAVTTGSEAPAWGRGSHGCDGCYTSCSGAYYDCGGCYGRRSGRHNRCNGCSGCWSGGGCYGGCYGYVSYGCYNGCWGGRGCHGGYYGYRSYGCQGCWGGSYLEPPRVVPPARGRPGEMVPAPKPGIRPSSTALPAPATIRVSLPPDAKLFVEDILTNSTSNSRQFVSPPLEPGKVFYYTLKGQMVRNGQALTTTQRVPVRAGQETEVSLELPTFVASR